MRVLDLGKNGTWTWDGVHTRLGRYRLTGKGRAVLGKKERRGEREREEGRGALGQFPGSGVGTYLPSAGVLGRAPRRGLHGWRATTGWPTADKRGKVPTDLLASASGRT